MNLFDNNTFIFMDMCTGAKHLWINTQFWETNTQFFPPARADSSSRLNRSCAVCRASGEKGVSTNGDPKNGWLLLENPMKVDDLEVPPFQETSLNGSLEMTESCHVRAGNTRYINHHLICFKLMPSSCWICCPPVSKNAKPVSHTHTAIILDIRVWHTCFPCPGSIWLARATRVS